MKEKDVMTGVVQRYLGRNVSINLGRVDAILNESEQVKGENIPSHRAGQGICHRGKRIRQRAQESLCPGHTRTW